MCAGKPASENSPEDNKKILYTTQRSNKYLFSETKPFLCLFYFFGFLFLQLHGLGASTRDFGTWYTTVQGDWSEDAMIYRLTKGWAKAKITDPKCSPVIAQWHRPTVLVDSGEGSFRGRSWGVWHWWEWPFDIFKAQRKWGPAVMWQSEMSWWGHHSCSTMPTNPIEVTSHRHTTLCISDHQYSGV